MSGKLQRPVRWSVRVDPGAWLHVMFFADRAGPMRRYDNGVRYGTRAVSDESDVVFDLVCVDEHEA